MNIVHPHYAILYLDQGKPQVAFSADSLASFANYSDPDFIRPGVTEQFMKLTSGSPQPMPFTPSKQTESWTAT